MTNPLIMEDRHWQMVEHILLRYPYTFYAFGSRAHGKPRKLSDLDLCFQDNIPLNVQAHIDEDFEESDLPFVVDLIDFNRCKKEFRHMIAHDLIALRLSPASNTSHCAP